MLPRGTRKTFHTLALVALFTLTAAIGPTSAQLLPPLTLQLVSVNPTAGPTGGGQVVTITSLTALPLALLSSLGAVQVQFGGVNATSPTIVDATHFQVTTPPHAAGTVDVTLNILSLIPLVIPGAQGTLSAGYTYVSGFTQPEITGVTPSAGLLGTPIEILGSGFLPGALATIGGVPLLNQIVTPTSILGNIPTGALGGVPGLADLVVTNPGGATDTLLGAFNILPTTALLELQLGSTNPSLGPTSGGQTVIIESLTSLPVGLLAQLGVVQVLFGGVPAPTASVIDLTHFSVVTPPHAAGTVDVTLIVLNAIPVLPAIATGTLSAGYTYASGISNPTIGSVTPNSGTGGTPVTITGTGFQAGATVLLDGLPLSNVVITPTSITGNVPAGSPGPADLLITNPDGGAAALPAAFTYTGGALLDLVLGSIIPVQGPTSGGTPFVITTLTALPVGLLPGLIQVDFGGAVATNISLVDLTHIAGITPPHVAGTVDVLVRLVNVPLLPPLITASLADAYTYVNSSGAAPTVTSVVPPSGTAGTALQINGTNFQPGASVLIGQAGCNNVVVVSATQITCSAPTNTPGPKNVTVTNPDGGSGTLPNGFTYTGGGLSLQLGSISPTQGTTAGGTLVRITTIGAIALPLAGVNFDGVPATEVQLDGLFAILARTPAHLPGTVDVTVRLTDILDLTDGLLDLTLANGYTYVAPPTAGSINPISGPTAGGTPVVITGSNFRSGMSVTFGGSGASPVNVLNANTLSTVTPPHAAGPVNVVVSNIENESATMVNGFTYLAGGFSSVDVTSIIPTSGTNLTPVQVNGTGFLPGAQLFICGLPAGSVIVSATIITALAPNCPLGAQDVTVVNPDGGSDTLVDGFTYTSGGGGGDDDCTFTGPDADGDCVPDTCEIMFGLDPNSGTGDDGPDGDPDHDGRTNQQECEDGTHPRGFYTRYFAEGASGSFFNIELDLLNPGLTKEAKVLVRYLTRTLQKGSDFLAIAPRTRATVDPELNPVTADAEFSTIIESDELFAAERKMIWDGTQYGSHMESALISPATVWYLAEGATHSDFNLFYLIQNPGTAPAAVTVTYLLPAGKPALVRNYTVAAQSRFNIWVNLEAPELADEEISAVVQSTNGIPILVERAMYLNSGGLYFGAGHESAGVTEPRQAWYFAEGASGDYFDTFVLVANPNAVAAQVQATYYLPDGSVIIKPHTVLPNSRFTIWTDYDDPLLENNAYSVKIESVNGVAVIAERAMWWPGPQHETRFEAHNSAGATDPGLEWAFAGAELGGTTGIETYVLVANTSIVGGSVDVTVLPSAGAGSPITRTFGVEGSSRLSINLASSFPEMAGKKFGVIITSSGPDVIVEASQYSTSGGIPWAAGSNTLATRVR